ncbi:MAG: putative quinone oxidoreductase, family, partial [Pseudonocardia sp.]|nr:putative quinone oxidoreductase, family [Pseudonocardia sp.]
VPGVYAITVQEPGGPDVLEWTEYPDPTPGPGEVLIDIAATAVNRADILQRQGHYPPPPGASEIIGLECSGRIAELGAGSEDSGLRVGDEVCALLSGGGYAERVAVPAGQVLPVPPGFSLVEAGGLAEAANTVWSNLVGVAHLKPGEIVLINGGSGGIGTHAIQVTRALGARVAVTAGSPERLERCRALGAEILIDYHDDVPARLREATDGHGADVILDNMGASQLRANVDMLAADGRLVVIGMQGGSRGEIDLGKLLYKRGTVAATTLRYRPAHGPAGKAAVVAATREGLWPLITAGEVRPVVHTTISLDEAAKAHELVEAGGVVGKVLLVPPKP